MKTWSRSVAPLLVGAVLVAAAATSGCTTVAAGKGVIARVNGQDIQASALQEQFDQMKKASPQTFAGTDAKAREAEFKAKILESLIQIELVRQEAKRLGVEPTDKQVDAYLKQLQTQYGGQKGLEDAMKQSGVTMDQLKVSIRSRIMVDAVTKEVAKSVAPTDAEIQSYYDKNKGMFVQQEQVRAYHILVAEKDKALADSILAQLKAGADFATLAKKYSTDPGSKANGGDLGWAPATQYVAEFAKAVTEMKVNELRIVHTQFGWHVIKLIESRPAVTKAVADVKDQIVTTLKQKAATDQFTKYIEDLRLKANVEVLDAALKKAVEAAKNATATAAPIK